MQGSVVDEFVGAELGDQRRSKRLSQIVPLLERAPAAGFPHALGSDADLEGFYRFINNDAFSAEAILAPHVRAAYRRAEDATEVVAIHVPAARTPSCRSAAPRRMIGA
jgi:hypothetical protein